MLDFGWQEFLVVAVVTVLVVGPNELPRVFRTMTGFVRKVRSLAGEFHSAMDDMVREADLQDIKKQIEDVKNDSSDWVEDIDPTGEVEASVRDIKGAIESARMDMNDAGRSEPNGAETAASVTASKPSVAADPLPKPAKKTAARKTPAGKAASKRAAARKSAAAETAGKTAGGGGSA